MNLHKETIGRGEGRWGGGRLRVGVNKRPCGAVWEGRSKQSWEGERDKGRDERR